MLKPKAIIVDIDGTLANVDHRVGLLPDWDSFFAAQKDDTVNEWCRNLLWRYHPDYTIFYITGRPEKYREVTKKWLMEKECPTLGAVDLYMRPDTKHDNDDEVKKKIYEDHIKNKYDVEFVIDDRDKVVAMWRELGLVCLQCAEGNF